MFSYPLTFETVEEHKDHIKNNADFYNSVLDKIEMVNEEIEFQKQRNEDLQNVMQSMMTKMNKMEEERNQQIEELKKTKDLLKDTVELEELIKKKTGESSVHKGSCDEKYIEIVMKEVAGDRYRVENNKKTESMDIRLFHVESDFTIGIECKDKGKITKTDIDKFKRDKVLNKFKRSIFISTNPIKGIIENMNDVVVDGDELYIVTDDRVFLTAVMKHYLCQLENNKDECYDTKIIFDSVIDVYNNWQATKKTMLKLDKSILRSLKLTPEFQSYLTGHLYFAPISKLKAKCAY